MAVGGTIPAPTIRATEGDVLQVTFHNKMDVETSIHWHGILLPNAQDGVPYLTTMPIRPGKSLTYRYPIIQSGTYWYHSHTNLQEQRGVYGALVFYPKKEIFNNDQDHVVVLSDWIDENPQQVLANLKRDGDYYALKKGSVQSWDQVVANGWTAIRNRILGAWIRMGPMDISDISYDAFLSNGNKVHQLGTAKKGDRIRLRIINAAASSYFNVEFSGGNMEVISADGLNVQPFKTSRIKIAIAETYDVIVTIPDDRAYEFRATAEDGTGFSSTIIGEGPLVPAHKIPGPNLFRMKHGTQSMFGAPKSSVKMEMSKKTQMPNMKMNHTTHLEVNKSEYFQLKSHQSTVLSDENPIRVVRLDLTGNMERFVWSFNNKMLSEADKILIKKGENVRFELVNKTMMHHPLHLHGHFFRVLNGQGDYSPLKHTVNVPPMEKVIIEFYANEEKDWFFHCHNLYHMKAGMTRIVRYEGTQTDPALIEARKSNPNRHDNQWFFSQSINMSSNKTFGLFRPSNARNAFELEFDVNYSDEYDIETKYLRSLDRFTDIYFGGTIEKEGNSRSASEAVIGVRYVLPLLIESELEYGAEGLISLELASKLQLTERTAFIWEWKTTGKYKLELEYEISKKISLSANYDANFFGGVGLRVNL
ncbi:MAG: multicopper oxidase domain-containing protein [Candidatus Margulisbacteria bacterium]|nr:multicopper oxidase domain-containing protein [Candidatus Margulisiibacteriota bacterium]